MEEMEETVRMGPQDPLETTPVAFGYPVGPPSLELMAKVVVAAAAVAAAAANGDP